MTDSTVVSNNFVIQGLIQQADELTRLPFGLNSKVTVLGDEPYLASNIINVNSSVDSNALKIEEVDDITANQILRSVSASNTLPQYQVLETSSGSNVVYDTSASALSTTLNYSNGELFQDPNPPQIIRRPAAQGPITYRQNVRVRFLQPPPVPPPGPLIIKEVRPPQPPAPRPLVVRQQAPPLPTPPPLVLRERPPQGPPPIPSQTVIKRLPPIPVPPRSVIVERFPAAPPRPRDIVIERWLPYSKEPQRRKVITHRAPPPRPYPQPRNTVIVYDPVQANVVRSLQKLGVQPQNPQDYVFRYGNTLLDSSTLVAQAQSAGVIDDLSPPFTNISNVTQQYQNDVSEYYLNASQTIWEPEYQYTASTWENQATNNNEAVQVYWTNPYEDVRTVLQRLGLPIE